MPTSDHNQIPAVVDILLRRLPNSALDVGIGFGKWGFLLREYCDIYARRAQPGQTDRYMIVDGVEPDISYVQPWHDHIYDTIYTSKRIDELLDIGILRKYDLIIMADVLEHMDKETGKRVLASLSALTDCLIVTTPDGFTGNKYPGHELETHVCGWSVAELAESGATSVTSHKGQLLAVWE